MSTESADALREDCRFQAEQLRDFAAQRVLLVLKSSTAVCHCCIAGANQQPKARRSE